MNSSILALGLLLSFNSFAAAGIPNLHCVGTASDKSVQLEYRDGGAAFMNVYAAEMEGLSYIAVLNISNPVDDETIVPVTMLIGNTLAGKVYAQRDVDFSLNGKMAALNTRTEDGKRLTLTCLRLRAQ